MMGHVTSETLALTGVQRPYTSGSLGSDNIYYSLNPSGTRSTPSPQPSNTTQTAKTFYDRGVQFAERRDYETAIAGFTEAIRIDPNYAEAYCDRGIAYFNKKDYDRALVDFSQAIRIDHNLKEAYKYRGRIYYSALKYRDYDKAIADYSQAILIDSNYREAYKERGLLYHDMENYDRAIKDFEAALNIEIYSIDDNELVEAFLARSKRERGW
jgi:tetratricopeptide (TPR) repeat protein